MQTIRRFETLEELARSAAASIVRVAAEAASRRGRCMIGLAGGSTPRPVYMLLAEAGPLRTAMPWPELHLFWGDERHVAPTDAESNYGMARATFLDRVPVVEAHVHRVRAEWPDAERVASDYEATIREVFGLKPGQVPVFDLILLGMGPDGHTASIFPGSPGVRDESRLVIAPWVEKFQAHRITMTGRVLVVARHLMVLAAGGEKAAALQAVLEGPDDRDRLPAQILRDCAGSVDWFVDGAAAARLTRS